MRSRNAIYNLCTALILQITSLIIGIILPRVMLISFGSEVNGLVSSIRQFINYLTLVEAGLAGACIYSLYKPLADENYHEVNSILSVTKSFYNKSGFVFSGLALILAFVFPYIVDSVEVSNLTITILVIILGINGSLEFFSMGKYRALLTADQRGYIISIVQTVGQVVNCGIIVSMSLTGKNIVVVQLFATTSYILRAILLEIYIKNRYKFIDFNVKHRKIELHQRWDVLIHQIGGLIVFNAPITLITFFCTLIEVSIYSIYNMVFAGINGIAAIFNSALMAQIGDIISRGNISNLQRIYKEYEYGYYMIVTWIYSCTYILILPFVEIYTKGIQDANYVINEVAVVFIILGILYTIRMPQLTLVNAAGHFKETKHKVILEIIINISISIILIKYFGMMGALLGAVCSYSYRTIDLIFYVPKYITYLSVKYTIVRIMRGIVVGVLIVLPFIKYIQIKVDSMIEWIIWGIIVSVWSGICVILSNYILEKDTFTFLIKRIIKVFYIKERESGK